MKKTALLLLVAAAAVVVAVWIARPSAPRSGADRVLEGFRPEQVVGIRIEGADSVVTLRLGEGGWEVADREGYPADHDRALDLVRKAWELRPVQEMRLAPEQRARLRLLPPGTPNAAPQHTATSITFLDREGTPTATLLLGKRQTRNADTPGMPGMAVGRFVTTDSQSAALVTETFDDAAPSPKQWINRSFPPIEDPVSITRRSKQGNWQLSLQKDDSWALDGSPSPPDQARIDAMTRAWRNPSFDDVIPAHSQEASAFQPVESITIATRSGLTHILELGTPGDTTTPVRLQFSAAAPDKDTTEGPAAAASLTRRFGETLYLVPNSLADLLVRGRDSLMPDPAEPAE